MTTDDKKTLDDSIARLKAIKECVEVNDDISTHYDCQADLETIVDDLTKLLKDYFY